MIFGEAFELRIAIAVDAAVPDVRDVHAIICDEDRNERGAHAALFRFTLRGFVDAQVGEFDAGDEAIFFVAFRAIHLVGPGSLGVVLRLREELLHRIDGHLGGNFAGCMTAHSIGNDEQAVLRHDREVVLVMVALAADVRLAGDFNSKLLSHGSPNVEDGGRSNYLPSVLPWSGSYVRVSTEIQQSIVRRRRKCVYRRPSIKSTLGRGGPPDAGSPSVGSSEGEVCSAAVRGSGA